MIGKSVLALVPVLAVGIGSLSFGGGPPAVPLDQVELVSAAAPADENGELLAQSTYRYTGRRYDVWLYNDFRVGVLFYSPGYRYDGYRYGSYRNVGYRYSAYRYSAYRYDGYRYDAYRRDGYRYDGYRYR